MNDHALSTTLDIEPTPSASGGGQAPISEPVEAEPKAEPEAKKPETLRESIEHGFKQDDKRRVEAEKAKDGAKEEAAPKNADEPKEPAEEEKPAPEKTEQPARQRNGEESHVKAPSYLSRESQERWANVPRSVQREIEQREETTARATERYERLRDFDELAKSNGRDLRDSLQQVHRFENMMSRDPIAALNYALQSAGPRRPDGSPLSLFEVAQHIVSQGPQAYQQSMAQAHQQQQSQQQMQAQQTQREEQVKREAENRLLQEHVVGPFFAANPRAVELESGIAYFLQHGNIDQSLSFPQKLEVAYRLAERAADVAQPSQQGRDERGGPANDRVESHSSDPDRRAEPDLSGSRSIKSAPGGIPEEFEDSAKTGESIRDSLKSVMRRRA